MVKIRKVWIWSFVAAGLIFTMLRGPSVSNVVSTNIEKYYPLPSNISDITNIFKSITITKPTVFLIMPTHKSKVQEANLVRHCQTFRQVDKVHWIVVEDAHNKTELVSRVLRDCSVWKYTHLIATKPKSDHSPHRGVHQRNAGLRWIRLNINPNQTRGVVYFSDDDNHYDTRLIDEVGSKDSASGRQGLPGGPLAEALPGHLTSLDIETRMRYVKKLGVWPVALAGGQSYEGPVVVNGTIKKWKSRILPNRSFPIDMAAFCLNIKLLFLKPNVEFLPSFPQYWLESKLLTAFDLSRNDAEPVLPACDKMMAWHTKVR